jgi:predicted MPP superfamily phosphohydrolase
MMTKSLGEADLTKFNLLLTHSPTNFEIYKSWGADLILSGHVHGGMIRVPFVGAVFSPDEGFMPKYSAGKYRLEDSILIVSRGLGRGSRGFRLFNRPNLVEITLKST